MAEDWQLGLAEQERQEVAFAQTYVRDFGHGTAGHNRLVLIDRLAAMLDAASSSGSPVRHVLDVPYHSQHEVDARWFRRDCGPACVEMVGEWHRRDLDASTNEIMRSITGGQDRGTYIRELQDAARDFYHLELDRHDGASWDQLAAWLLNRPVIVLVHYGSFAMRMDRGYTAGHFMVAVGLDRVDYQGESVRRVVLHDPDWWGDVTMAQGAFLPATQDHFMGMWEDCYKDGNPRRMALVPVLG